MSHVICYLPPVTNSNSHIIKKKKTKNETLAVIDNYKFNVILSATDTAQLFQTVAISHYTLYSTHYTIHTIHYTLHTSYYTLHTKPMT